MQKLTLVKWSAKRDPLSEGSILQFSHIILCVCPSVKKNFFISIPLKLVILNRKTSNRTKKKVYRLQTVYICRFFVFWTHAVRLLKIMLTIAWLCFDNDLIKPISCHEGVNRGGSSSHSENHLSEFTITTWYDDFHLNTSGVFKDFNFLVGKNSREYFH